MKIMTQLLSLTGVLVFALFAPLGFAQYQQDGASPAGPPAATVNVSDGELEQFVEAEQEVQSIQQTYTQEIAAAETQEEAQSLQAQAQQEMVGAVEGTGLSVQDYNRIATVLQSDQELRSRAEQLR